MTREQEIAIKGLNQFKNMNLLYGNKLGITIEGVKQLQRNINEALNLIKEQDKVIDELAYSLADYMMYYDYDKCRNPDMIKNKAERLKQYFERKVEDEEN